MNTVCSGVGGEGKTGSVISVFIKNLVASADTENKCWVEGLDDCLAVQEIFLGSIWQLIFVAQQCRCVADNPLEVVFESSNK